MTHFKHEPKVVDFKGAVVGAPGAPKAAKPAQAPKAAAPPAKDAGKVKDADEKGLTFTKEGNFPRWYEQVGKPPSHTLDAPSSQHTQPSRVYAHSAPARPKGPSASLLPILAHEQAPAAAPRRRRHRALPSSSATSPLPSATLAHGRPSYGAVVVLKSLLAQSPRPPRTTPAAHEQAPAAAPRGRRHRALPGSSATSPLPSATSWPTAVPCTARWLS